MSRRRRLPLLVASLLVLIGLALRPRSIGGDAKAVATPLPVGVALATAQAVPAEPAFGRTPDSASQTPEARRTQRRPVLYTLSPDETGLFAETCTLQGMACGTGLELDSRQWTVFAGVALNIQAIRQMYEAQIATGTELAPGRYRVEIPLYPDAGDAIRTRFYAELRAQMGEAAATEVAAKLGARLEGYFAGFGVSAQSLEITADPRGAKTDCEVTRTVRFWNSVEGTERLSTRRETHFPGVEDPTGERWSALLAVVGV